jgi:hypothetical protein
MDSFDLKNRLKAGYDKITGMLSGKDKTAIFGCGKIGLDLYPLVREYGLFGGFIDNDTEKQKEGYRGEPVWSVKEYLSNNRNSFIVIAVSNTLTGEIRSELESYGLRYHKDFIYVNEYLNTVFPLISFYKYNRLFVELSQICITERCTLKCVKCAHACNYVSKNGKDMPIDMVKKSADIFFSYVDIVKEFVLIGGEPFLYKKLDEAIEYIGKRYRKKMIMFSITTNGTILPNNHLIELIKKYGVTLRISDYSYTIPSLKAAYDKLYNIINSIDYIVLDSEKEPWFDYGFGEVDNGTDEEKLRAVFKNCSTPCREIRGSKYYYCVMARSVAVNTGRDTGLDEYLALDRDMEREELLGYGMGYIPNGYLSMCRYCRGADMYDHPIRAAVQMQK